MADDRHIPFINYVANEDAEGLVKAEESYAGSWKKRGGVGAFMMLARKWDRLEARAEKHGWDIFDAIMQDERSEGVIDDVRDLRRYLNLVESEMIARGATSAQAAHRDNAENPDSAGDLGAMEPFSDKGSAAHKPARTEVPPEQPKATPHPCPSCGAKPGEQHKNDCERIKGRQAAARADALRVHEDHPGYGHARHAGTGERQGYAVGSDADTPKTMPLAQRQMPELPRDCTAKEYEGLAPRDRQKYVFKNGRYWLKTEHYGERRFQ